MKNYGSKIDDSFIREFINSYFDHKKPLSKLEELYDILSLRGLLLESLDEKKGIVISDNSLLVARHEEKTDKDYLNDNIKPYGEIDDNNLLHINNFPDFEEYINFLKPYIFIGYETGPISNYKEISSFDNLKNLEYGIKIPVANLETFIAKLVKSVSSIGLDTSMSCQGHENNNYESKIFFYGCYNLIWFFVIFDNFVKKVFNIKCNWTIENYDSSDDAWQTNVLKITNPDGDLKKQYFEIINVADFIYDNRLFFRRMKRHLQNLDDNKVLKYSHEDSSVNANVNRNKLKLYKLFNSIFK